MVRTYRRNDSLNTFAKFLDYLWKLVAKNEQVGFFCTETPLTGLKDLTYRRRLEFVLGTVPRFLENFGFLLPNYASFKAATLDL